MTPARELLVCFFALGLCACGDTTGAGGGAEGGAAQGGGGGTAVDPSADPDGDSLSNADEAAAGTDPANADTDGDGYLDGDEVLEGSDPLDPDSGIYAGGWPYQRDKDQIEDPGFDGVPEVGGVIPRLMAYDQFGEMFDLYDLALHDGRPIVIDVSAIWCEACKQMAHWLAGEPSTIDSPDLVPVRERVANGDVYWVTVMFEDGIGNAAGPQEAVAWADAYPNTFVLVLADNERQMEAWLYPGSFPSVTVLNEDMTIRAYDRFDYVNPLLTLLD